MDFPSLVQTGATSIAVLVAGAGAYRLTHAGARFFERTEAKAVQVADIFLETQLRITAAQEKQANALETTANLIPLLENINENQRQIGGTLRAMNRKLQELEDLKEQVLSQLQQERHADEVAGHRPGLGQTAGEPTVPLDGYEKNS